MDGLVEAVTFRLCVDLNVWVSHFLANAKGLSGTVSQTIVQAVQDGRAGIGPVQLVISHTMLSRLHDVLGRKGVGPDTASRFIELIAMFARLGPAPEHPSVVLGGGAQPTRDAVGQGYDPYDPLIASRSIDPEDGRVLDTAIAGRATALVTANFRDFIQNDDTIFVPRRVHLRKTAAHEFFIVQPPEMAAWLATGRAPIPPAPD